LAKSTLRAFQQALHLKAAFPLFIKQLHKRQLAVLDLSEPTLQALQQISYLKGSFFHAYQQNTPKTLGCSRSNRVNTSSSLAGLLNILSSLPISQPHKKHRALPI
jgi:hypothetical protein